MLFLVALVIVFGLVFIVALGLVWAGLYLLLGFMLLIFIFANLANHIRRNRGNSKSVHDHFDGDQRGS